MAEENAGDAGMADEEVAAPPEQAREDTAQEEDGAKTMTVAGVSLDDQTLPLFIALVASIVLLIATTTHYDEMSTSYAKYAVSISSIAMILSFSTLVLAKAAEEVYEKVGKHANMVNFAWSFVGACFLTFKEPFTATGNGYFAAWALAFGLAVAIGMSAKEMRHRIKEAKAVMGLLASSLVVVVATIPPIRDGSTSYDPNVPTDPAVTDYKGEAVYALALACVSVAFILLQMVLEKKNKALKGLLYLGAMAILAICWILSACLVTFRGPFPSTGNGYFASWAGAGLSTIAAFAAKKAM